MTGPHLPTLTDCIAACDAVEEAFTDGTDAGLERAIIAQEQTERAHIAHMERRMPEAQ